MRKFAPVALFVYNRAETVAKTLDYLGRNFLAQDTELFIFSDAAKSPNQEGSVAKVREIISSVSGFKSVTLVNAEKNKGLANSIIGGVTELISKYGSIIVLEDDIVTSPLFLSFMNDALDFYKDNVDIWSISGYSFPIRIDNSHKKTMYFAYRSSSWGWATWNDRWETIDWVLRLGLFGRKQLGFRDRPKSLCTLTGAGL